MLPLGYYFIKVIICSGVLFGYYWLLLRNKIFHSYNRFYLLSIIAISIVTPLIHLDIFHKENISAQTIKLLQVINSNGYADETIVSSKQHTITTDQILMMLYWATSIVFGILFILGLLKINRLLKKHERQFVQEVCLVNTSAKGTPFSFLKYIFWNNNIDISTTTGNQIFLHELAHVQQKHSYDKLFINAVLIFFWCNPIFWLVRKELNMIHEFMADKIAVEDSDTKAFAAMILQAAYPRHRFPLTNPFFYSPIKRRLMMLTKNKNPKSSYLARVLVLPVALLMFAAFTLKTKVIKKDGLYTGKKITVVIDAGHGGKDIGGKSMDGTVQEKDLALSITKKIKAQNTNENIDIILTRDEDIYQGLPERVEFSKVHNADLFISLHVDAIREKSEDNIHSGMSVWVAKDNYTNSYASKLFASAIIQEFKQDYKLPVLVEFPQQRKTGIWVLQESMCPSVVIETGFITNKIDLAYLQTEEAKETIAKNVLIAIEKYANQHAEESVQLSADTILKDTAPKTTKKNTTTKKNNSLTKNTLQHTDESVQPSADNIIIDTIPKTTKKTTATKKNNNIPKNMLYVVNGKTVGNDKVASDKINKLQNIQSMNVITDKKISLKKYGLKGKNGAIEITTAPKDDDKIKIKKTIDESFSHDKDSIKSL